MDIKSIEDHAKETINALVHGFNTTRGEFVITEKIFSNTAGRAPERMEAFLAHWNNVLQRMDTVRHLHTPHHSLVGHAVGSLHMVAGDCMRGFYDTMVKSLDPKAEWCLEVKLKAIQIPGDDRAKTELIVMVLIPRQSGRNVITLYTQVFSLDLIPKPKKEAGDIRQRVTRNQVPGHRTFA